MMLLASLPTAVTLCRNLANPQDCQQVLNLATVVCWNCQQVHSLAAFLCWTSDQVRNLADMDLRSSLLSTNKAADFVLIRQSSLLRTKLATHLARHTQVEVPDAKTLEAQFQVATTDDAQNLNAKVIKAVPNEGSRSLLEANTARQISASYIGSNHVESAKVADSCKYA